MGQSSASTSSSSSKKEKKKQAKEERDRQKQAEKKKRRLEKALATATAIRIELEQKKQKRKEEEQRLDEEGAALAEAVALQVLVEDDRGIQSIDANFTEKNGNVRPLFSPRWKEFGQGIVVKPRCNSVRRLSFVEGENNGNLSLNNAAVLEEESEFGDDDFFCVENCSSCEAYSTAGDESRVTSERARDAEVAAGMAAAHAVAALRIAEEARAEAEAARIAVELSMAKNLGEKDSSYVDRWLNERTLPPKSAEEERDELKVQLLQLQYMLQEKTRRVFQLEQDLAHVKHYLQDCKAMTAISNNNDDFEVKIKREPEISSNATVIKSSSDSIDL